MEDSSRTSSGDGGDGGEGFGLIETMRAKDGRIPWLDRHLKRLNASCVSLRMPAPPLKEDLERLLSSTAGSGDRVIRIELRGGRAELITREVSDPRPPSVVVSSEIHRPYPHKTTARTQFDRSLANAKSAGADDAVLVTSSGYVAEGTAWNLFWWSGTGALCTPPVELGILPGVGRGRIMELTKVTEVRAPVKGLQGCSMFLVNAVRGIVEIGSFEGLVVPRDPRTAELSTGFWPD